MSFFGAAPVNFAGVSQVTSALGPNDPEIGYRLQHGNNSYLFVYNAGNSQIVPGLCAVLSGTSGYSVTLSSVTGTDVPVGIVKHATLTTGTYGWLLTRGYSVMQMHASDSAAVGSLLGIGVNGVVALKSNATNFAGPSIGQSRDAIASGGSGTGYLSFP